MNEHSRLAMSTLPALLALGWLCTTATLAQQGAPSAAELAVNAAKRFPQAVRVGDLIHRTVLEPVESRRILGHVDRVIRLDGTKTAVVMTYGGVWGLGTHKIAVPVDAMGLLGYEVEVLDFTPKQLGAFPTYDGAGEVLGPDDSIHMGLAHPSH